MNLSPRPSYHNRKAESDVRRRNYNVNEKVIHNELNNSEDIFSSESEAEHSEEERDDSRYEECNKSSPKLKNVSKAHHSEEVKSNHLLFILLKIISGSVAIFLVYNFLNSLGKHDLNMEEDTLYIREQFNKYGTDGNETWSNIQGVLEDIIRREPSYPAVFLFLYEQKNNTVNKLVYLLARYASKKLKSPNFSTMDKNDLHSSEARLDYGYILHKYYKSVQENKVLVTHDLHAVPGFVAQAFHSFCDEITPIIEQAVYIFTMQVKSLKGKAVQIAHEELFELWSDLSEDKRLPLITRVTSSVIKIVNVK